jgi:hypothetical protein
MNKPIFLKAMTPLQKYSLLALAAFGSLAFGIWWSRRKQ